MKVSLLKCRAIKPDIARHREKNEWNQKERRRRRRKKQHRTRGELPGGVDGTREGGRLEKR